jgi:hypothetical protein
MKRALRMALLGALTLLCSAHVGSPDAWYEGPAGPYTVLVHVQAPPVIPGIAVVNVKPGDAGITRVTAVVNRFDAVGNPPPPDVAEPVADHPGWYRTRLWVMTAGSNSVTIAIRGARGEGSVVVPLTAVAARRLGFSPLLAGLLLALGAILLTGLLTVVGAAVREGVLPPGEQPDPKRRRRARFAMIRAFVVVALGLTAWTLWWRASDRRFVRNLFRPLSLSTRTADAAGPRLFLTIADSIWIHRNDGAWLRARRLPEQAPLIEDHGKLVHLFLLAAGGRTGFAHLHPFSVDTVTFETALPPLPGGTYWVFADIVQQNGFTQTLTSTLTLPPNTSRSSRNAAVDPDNAWALGNTVSQANRVVLEDGSTLSWLRPAAPLLAGIPAELRFAIAGPPGDSASLEPYLGMAGHAVVVRDDGSVFIHLHPLGTISLAAQAQLAGPRGPLPHSPTLGDTLAFPYAFPKEGNYTVWVQLKRGGRILTGSFAAAVLSEPEGAP